MHRLANTPLSPNLATLDLYFGEDFQSSFCPDIGEPFEAATTLSFGLRGAIIAPGAYPLFAGSNGSGNYLYVGFAGRIMPSVGHPPPGAPAFPDESMDSLGRSWFSSAAAPQPESRVRGSRQRGSTAGPTPSHLP